MFIGLLACLVNGSNHTKCVSLSNQKGKTNPPLLIYILLNIATNFTTIHFQLN